MATPEESRETVYADRRFNRIVGTLGRAEVRDVLATIRDQELEMFEASLTPATNGHSCGGGLGAARLWLSQLFRTRNEAAS